MYTLLINDTFQNDASPSIVPPHIDDDIESFNSDINKSILIEDNNSINLNNIDNIDINNIFNHNNTTDNFLDLLGPNNKLIVADFNNNIYNNLFSTNSYSRSIRQNNENLNEKNNKMIFRIEKDNKNKGRIRKNSNLKGRHNKFSEDNIIRKIKCRFLEKCRMYINNEYRKYKLKHRRHKKKDDWIQRINPKVSRIIKRDDNLKWLKSKLYEIYSEKVSTKCSLHKPDHNKKEIEKLLKKNKAKDVISILNKSVKEMFYIFCNNIKIEGFETLDDDLKSLKEKLIKDKEYNIDIYLEKYKNVVKSFETIFIKKNSRNNK
jgi:hypothetical protein